MTPYQIALLSYGSAPERAALEATLRNKCSELGVSESHLSILDANTLVRRDRKGPTVAAFISNDVAPTSDLGVSSLLEDNITVVPVVPDLRKYTQYVPNILHPINGMELAPREDPNLEAVASVLLENLDLLRRSRRIFISYMRTETCQIAIQLYEVLDAHGFDVFLDTRSIRPGDPFQEILWHRLADTDVIVVLDSPNFALSKWAVAEVARANSTNIQILQLIWPDTNLDETFAFSKPALLAYRDFENAQTVGAIARLTQTCLERITTETESLRARAIAARHAYLVEEFCAEAKAIGLLPIVQPARFIELELAERHIITVPTVGIPDAPRYQQIEKQATDNETGDELILLYDERGIRDQWLEHIEWLDGQLKVRSLQVSKIRKWLKEARS